MHCPRCGKQNEDTRSACINCFAQLRPVSEAKPVKIEIRKGKASQMDEMEPVHIGDLPSFGAAQQTAAVGITETEPSPVEARVPDFVPPVTAPEPEPPPSVSIEPSPRDTASGPVEESPTDKMDMPVFDPTAFEIQQEPPEETAIPSPEPEAALPATEPEPFVPAVELPVPEPEPLDPEPEQIASAPEPIQLAKPEPEPPAPEPPPLMSPQVALSPYDEPEERVIDLGSSTGEDEELSTEELRKLAGFDLNGFEDLPPIDLSDPESEKPADEA